MARQTQAPQAQAGKAPTKPTPTSDRIPEAVDVVDRQGTAFNQGVPPSLLVQAARLGDPRFAAIQRQAVADQIGQVQGNGHLGRAVARATQRPRLHPGQLPPGQTGTLQRNNDAAGPVAPTPLAEASGEVPTGPQTVAEEERYDISLRVAPRPEETYAGVPRTEALRILREFYHRIHNRVEAGYDAHQALKEIRDDQWIVGAVSDFFADPLAGGIEMPPLWMWSGPRVALGAALATLNAGQIEPTARNLQQAADAWRVCDRAIYNYREGTISGAERSVAGLKVTAAAGAVAATMATGGLATAAGASGLGVAAATGLGAGVYGFVQEEAGQASEIYNDLRRDFDWGAIVHRGATDAISGFVGAFVGGALTDVFKRSFGSYLANISDDVLREMGLTREAFLTPAQQFTAEFLGGIGSSPLTTAVTAAVEAAAGGNPPRNAQEFVDRVVQDMVQGGAIQLFLGGLTHYRGGTGGGARPAGGETPSTPRPTFVEEGAGVSRPGIPAETSVRSTAPAGEAPITSLPSATMESPASQRPSVSEVAPGTSPPSATTPGAGEASQTSGARTASAVGEGAQPPGMEGPGASATSRGGEPEVDGGLPMSEAHNATEYARYRAALQTAESAGDAIDSLRTRGTLPESYMTKGEAISAGWEPGKALHNSAPGRQIGGDVFRNENNVVPPARGRTWQEADIGLNYQMSRAKNPGTRLLYSSDGLLYVTTNHYQTAHPIGRWK